MKKKAAAAVPAAGVSEMVDEIKSLRQQLDAKRKREVMLRGALSKLFSETGVSMVYSLADTPAQRDARNALADTSDLSDRILCKREPVRVLFQHVATFYQTTTPPDKADEFARNNKRWIRCGNLYQEAK